MQTEDCFFQIVVGTVYSLEYIHDFKIRLEIKQGVQMIICQNSKQFSFQCSNPSRELCPFIYTFIKKMDVDTKQMGYQLLSKNLFHSSECKVNNEQMSFQRNRWLIIQSKDFATNIILSRYKLYGPQNPKKILQILSVALGYQTSFIYTGLKNAELKRRIKKKFDNLVAEIRRQYSLTPTVKLPNIKRKKNGFTICFSRQSNSQSQQQNVIAQDISKDNDSSSQFNPRVERRLPKSRKIDFKKQSTERQTVKQQRNSDQEQVVENNPKTQNTKQIKKAVRKITKMGR